MKTEEVSSQGFVGFHFRVLPHPAEVTSEYITSNMWVFWRGQTTAMNRSQDIAVRVSTFENLIGCYYPW